jgi:DNA-binding LacI/PurR family transcriptional regulator
VFNAAMYMAHEMTVSVPRDLSLCSFASAWEQVGMPYEITCVRLPEPEMARAAVGMLMSAVDEKIEPSAVRPLTGTFQIGRTTATLHSGD